MSESSAITAAQEIVMPAAPGQDEAVCVRGADAERAGCECGRKISKGGGRKETGDRKRHLVGTIMVWQSVCKTHLFCPGGEFKK